MGSRVQRAQLPMAMRAADGARTDVTTAPRPRPRCRFIRRKTIEQRGVFEGVAVRHVAQQPGGEHHVAKHQRIAPVYQAVHICVHAVPCAPTFTRTARRS